MLYVVIERFKDSDAKPIGKRFKLRGRTLPEGVTYHDSWIDLAGTRCYQIMETANAELLGAWIRRWEDLIEFEIVAVLPSADFWAKKNLE